MAPILSICIPAYKRKEPVVKTLDSIFNQATAEQFEEFEVIVSENDKDRELKEVLHSYLNKYPNFVYRYSDCEGFMNSYYSMTYAKGDLIKLHNSQSTWNDGSLRKIIDLAKQYKEEKPLLFFSDGRRETFKVSHYDSFDSFMYALSYFSSWSNGFSIWREDFEKNKNIELNKLFPHTSIFMTQYSKSSFVVDDRLLFDYQKVPKKGGHNMFKSFSIDYTGIIEQEFKLEHISYKTYKKIKKDLILDFFPYLHFLVFIARTATYESDNFKTNLRQYYPSIAYYTIPVVAVFYPFKMILSKLKRYGKK